MKAMCIIASNTDGTPATATTIPTWVHLRPSLTGTFHAYLVAAPAATLDALLLEPSCVVVLRFKDTDNDGNVTRSELDAEHEPLRAVFNQFATAQGLDVFPAGTTPRQLLAAYGIDGEAADVYDDEAGA